MNVWNIQSRAHACQACGKAFSDQQSYHTLLFDERQQYKRLDVCEPCWQTQFSQGGKDHKGFVSYWQGLYEAPPPAPPEAIRRETAESLLRKLVERNDPHYAAASYILAVMLERKRLLKVKEQLVRDGHRVFVYEHPQSGDLFTIPDPDLQLDQLEPVQRDVAHLLEHGLDQPAVAAPAPAFGAVEDHFPGPGEPASPSSEPAKPEATPPESVSPAAARSPVV